MLDMAYGMKLLDGLIDSNRLLRVQVVGRIESLFILMREKVEFFQNTTNEFQNRCELRVASCELLRAESSL